MLMQTLFGSIGVKYISVAYRNYIFGNVPNFVEVGLFGTSYDFQIKFNVCCCPLLSVSGSVKIIANGFCYGACRIFTSMFFDLYYFQIFNFLSKFLQPEECTIIHCNRIFVIKLVIISTEIFPVLNRVCL
ncbi:MAG: hypothetical protein BWX51_00232 [Bacteroidetes bacterium ADurb.Bin012]|jgi:hypothetical protein|nr:MAG: hypothetical protein BWX51_00232 [Bacteroidetes bacterium ADurb.Bin012]